MQKRPCAACRKKFTPNARVPEQRFCQEKPCQRERRRRWQKNKRRGDADYRENERRAQRSWGERHPEYWQAYRRKHPEYRQRNRLRQRQRDERRRGARTLANAVRVLANGDVWKVQIAVLPGS
ncbi:MAG: hypothetical protein JWO04_3077 [Gammaproteobacteria bacterium]|nr:hypothetical protein [Gammaproteobacteria bacterium]